MLSLPPGCSSPRAAGLPPPDSSAGEGPAAPASAAAQTRALPSRRLELSTRAGTTWSGRGVGTCSPLLLLSQRGECPMPQPCSRRVNLLPHASGREFIQGLRSLLCEVPPPTTVLPRQLPFRCASSHPLPDPSPTRSHPRCPQQHPPVFPSTRLALQGDLCPVL